MQQLRTSRVVVNESKPQPLSDLIRGKAVQRMLTTHEQLLIRFTDGTEIRMSWRDDNGRMVGTPFLDDVRRWK